MRCYHLSAIFAKELLKPEAVLTNMYYLKSQTKKQSLKYSKYVVIY